MAGRFELLLNRVQTPSETEFVAVGINQVEEALIRLGIAGRRGWLAPCCQRTFIECINIGDVEDNAAHQDQGRSAPARPDLPAM